MTRVRAGMRLGAGGLLLGLTAAGVLAVRFWPHQVTAAMAAATHALKATGPEGWLLAALAQVLIAFCGILPASAGALAAGVLYGIVPGFLLSAFGTLIGAALAFGLARSLFRPLVARRLAGHPRAERLDQAVARDGWRLVCLMRVSPVMPFALTSYALALTALRLRDYMIGTLAALPALLGYVVLGALAGTGFTAFTTHRMQPLHWAVLAVATVATVLLTLRIGRMIGRVLRLPDGRVTEPAEAALRVPFGS